MRRALKHADSKILTDGLRYKSNNSLNNRQIANVLFVEQKGFCAYTDECLTVTDARDIEHFNPELKNTVADNYYNWFLVKHRWNQWKLKKWDKLQPVLHPTAEDFEDRIVYYEGDYVAISEDVDANHTIQLLNLDDPALARKRKQYIARKRSDIEVSAESPEAFFAQLLKDDCCSISYPRAIREEFGVDVLALIA